MSPNPQEDGAETSSTPHEPNKPSDITPPTSLPPRPNPSADPKLFIEPQNPNLELIASPQLNAQPDNIFEVPPLAALKLLSAGIEALVRITGDIPPTPPPTTPHMPNMRGMQAEKDGIRRNYSERSLARMREKALESQTKDAGNTPGPPTPILPDDQGAIGPACSQQSPEAPVSAVPKLLTSQAIDGVHLKATASPDPSSFASPPPPPTMTPEPFVIIGANSQPLNMQHNAITRKFYSKKPPPIGISDYLLRIHRFCPMSTAVYLATSLYIHRLAVDERAVAVTRRNAHRLLLAGLRVAMKVLEDLSYPHAKLAKVGGVSDMELARLEISFCFLCGFELVVSARLLQEHWTTMKNGPDLSGIGSGMGGGSMPLPGLSLANLPRPRNRPEGVVEG
ncbi:PHO85 cyclin-7 [Cytospora mali]|uniref:PHO85 cyclin-7 n=1 Tax=Cytospora mali TaxID=578113 RepID=A0A194VL20_CYTMA|nr:PHO85 cyclin-7 [Valsa mali]